MTRDVGVDGNETTRCMVTMSRNAEMRRQAMTGKHAVCVCVTYGDDSRCGVSQTCDGQTAMDEQ